MTIFKDENLLYRMVHARMRIYTPTGLQLYGIQIENLYGRLKCLTVMTLNGDKSLMTFMCGRERVEGILCVAL